MQPRGEEAASLPIGGFRQIRRRRKYGAGSEPMKCPILMESRFFLFLQSDLNSQLLDGEVEAKPKDLLFRADVFH